MSSREVDRWSAGSHLNPLIYRVMEDEETGVRTLQVRSKWDEDFRTPSRGHGTELASRLMKLFELDEKVIRMSDDRERDHEGREKKYA